MSCPRAQPGSRKGVPDALQVGLLLFTTPHCPAVHAHVAWVLGWALSCRVGRHWPSTAMSSLHEGQS